jgi:hypothetical protein
MVKIIIGMSNSIDTTFSQYWVSRLFINSHNNFTTILRMLQSLPNKKPQLLTNKKN